MSSMYDPRSALPVNARGKSPMQPVCANRLNVGHKRLIEAAKADDVAAATLALDGIAPLLACQFRNGALPCAQACDLATDTLGIAFQEAVLKKNGALIPQTPPPGWALAEAGAPPK